ncbi:MAG TPA: hypothetical protein VLZ30_06395 [Verrucomicrobiae bacterium]|nr:hypothetical protein [Verrucomicrobiae bacterium]
MIAAKSFSRRLLAVTYGGLLLCAGCDPQDWICWAPDGQHALLRGADDTWLVDSSGKILGKATDARAWLPDSRRVIAVHAVKPTSWDEYAKLLSPERAEKTAKAAASMVEVIQKYHGDWAKFGDSPEFKKWESEAVGQTFAAEWLTASVALYLQQTNPKVLAPILEASFFSITNLTPDIYELSTCNVLPSDPPAKRLLTRLPDEILAVFPSPNGQVLAFAVGEPDRPALYVIAQSTNSSPVLVDKGVTEAAWSTDGQDLVYPKTTVPYELLQNSMQLGTITSRRVCGTNGQVLATFADPKDLAGTILGQSDSLRSTLVACLPDGRILFAAASIRLPALSSDEPNHLTLFAIRPGPTPTLESIVRPADISRLPNRVDRFALSPDKKRASIVDSEGNVSVVSLESGELLAIQPTAVYSNADKFTQLIPTWRTTNEVTCLVPIGDSSGSTARAEVVLANLNGQKTAISLSWSNATMKGLLLPSD